ncbi:endonuclease [Sphingomonas sp. Leaf17]|nr:endonuclease [Sphingomonas sp. Leaf17]
MRFVMMLAALVAMATPATAKDGPRDLRVMSFNVRLPIASDGPNAWAQRRDLLVATIARADPDIIGTQELFKVQGDYIVGKLPAFTWFGRDRRGGHGDEHMGVFYRRDRMTLLASGDFWLSDTPDTIASITWGHPLPRMVTWGKFRTRTGRTFYLFDTHFPYRAEDESARTRAAALIARRIATIAGTTPVVLTGDFNTVPGSAAYATLTASLTDTRIAGATGPVETFHDFTGTPDRRIDWIFARRFTPRSYATITDHDGVRYSSDHFPVMTVLRWR